MLVTADLLRYGSFWLVLVVSSGWFCESSLAEARMVVLVLAASGLASSGLVSSSSEAFRCGYAQ